MAEHVKVVVFATKNSSFMSPIMKELTNRSCLVHTCYKMDVDSATILDQLQWADCAFFDFLHPPIAWATQLATVNCRMTARLHGLEIYDKYINQINWSRIHLITSAPQFLRWKRLQESIPLSGIKDVASEHVINLGVDTSPTKNLKEVFGYNIAITAATPLPRKRLYTTIESFYDLFTHNQTQKDHPWTLNIRGIDFNPHGWRGDEANEYVEFMHELLVETNNSDFVDNVVFHDRMLESEWQSFLKGMDVIIDNSMQEGYHKSVLEAMSYGAMPFVHRWLGADQIYPPQCLFLTQRELVDKMIAWAELPITQKKKLSLQLQNIVRDLHDEKKLAKEAVDVILGVQA